MVLRLNLPMLDEDERILAFFSSAIDDDDGDETLMRDRRGC